VASGSESLWLGEGWICYVPPHPHPLPPGAREIIGVFPVL